MTTISRNKPDLIRLYLIPIFPDSQVRSFLNPGDSFFHTEITVGDGKYTCDMYCRKPAGLNESLAIWHCILECSFRHQSFKTIGHFFASIRELLKGEGIIHLPSGKNRLVTDGSVINFNDLK